MAARRTAVFGLLVLATAVVLGTVVFRSVSPAAVWASAAVTAVVAVVLAEDYRRRQARPLRTFADGARRIAAGELGFKVYPRGTGADTADLGRAFNSMSERLAERSGRLEDDLRQLRAVLSGMVEGVVSLDVDQRILFANDRAGQLLEFHPQTVVGRRFWEVVRHRRLQEAVTRVLAGTASGREELEWKGPAVTHLSVYAARLTGGASPRAILVLHDTTDVRRLERVRQEFIANVNHELKTPLAVIKASVETLMNGAAADPDHRGTFLEQIDEQADRLHALILDMLSLARIESGEIGVEFQPVPIERTVCDCLDRHRHRAEGKGQTLIPIPPTTAGHISAWADQEALDTILDNVVDNAIKYTPPGGWIRIAWSELDGQASLQISDTGIGIPERDLPRVFERFYRVDRARSRELGGTGLGLSIVKHLVQTMQGTVTVKSTVGLGTTVSVLLPLSNRVSSLTQ